MSQIYNLEPPTKGKVVLRTTLGDLDIELWAKEAPISVRNFVQLCLEGYYDDTIFHRLIKNFLIQGGDPTGTGDGGESVYGQPFKDEIHSRLRFSHRGIIAWANQNLPNTNGSQFFITMDKTEQLNQKATIFGKITGDTLYNLPRFNELETDTETDRPIEPPKIIKAEVLWNPFDDIEPRKQVTLASSALEENRTDKKKKNAARKASKNFKLISFGDEAEEEDAAEVEAAATLKLSSAHDILNDEKLSKEAVVQDELEKVKKMMKEKAATVVKKGHSKNEAEAQEEEQIEEEEDFAKKMQQKIHAKRTATTSSFVNRIPENKEKDKEHIIQTEIIDIDDAPSPTTTINKESLTDTMKISHKRDRASLFDGHEPAKTAAAVVAPSKQIKVQDRDDLLTAWEQRRQEYKERKRLGGSREKETMTKLTSFIKKMKSASNNTNNDVSIHENKEERKEEKKEMGYDGKVDKDIDSRSYMPAAWRFDDYLGRSTTTPTPRGGGSDEGLDDESEYSLDALRKHKLVFVENNAKNSMKRTETIDDYVVLDPLLEAGKAKFNKEMQKRKKRGNEWAGRSAD